MELNDNYDIHLQKKLHHEHLKKSIFTWGMLSFRPIMFIIFQIIIVLFYLLQESTEAWENSLAWWPFPVIFTNIICIIIMKWNSQRQQKKFLNQFRFEPKTWKKDFTSILGILILSIIVMMGPNIGLAVLLFNNPQAGLELMNYPLPLWALGLSVIFLPLTQLFAEIPFYMLYLAPKLQEQGVKPTLSFIIASLFLSFQHIAMPLVLNLTVIVYKMMMFLIFAQFLGFLIYRRPRLLPYLVIMHAIFDAQLIITNILL